MKLSFLFAFLYCYKVILCCQKNDKNTKTLFLKWGSLIQVLNEVKCEVFSLAEYIALITDHQQ